MSGGPVEEYARLIVAGACRGDAYVKYPSWYNIFLLYRVFAPNVLRWTFRLLLSPPGARKTSLVGMGRPLYEGNGRHLLEGSSPRKQPLTSTSGYSQFSTQQLQLKYE